MISIIPQKSLKDFTRLERCIQRVWHWNVNTQESYKRWFVNSLKRKLRWEHHSSLETNQARAGTWLRSLVKGELQIVFENQRIFNVNILFSTLNVAYDQIITSIVDSAQNHIKLADELNSQVVEVLKEVERKNEEAKKKVSQLATRNRLLHSIWTTIAVTILGTAIFPKVACRPWSCVHWPSQGWDCHSLISRSF